MVKIKWLGHAGFEIKINEKTVLIDPWLNGNPKAACTVADINAADIVCVTHDHNDHLGDSIEICKRTGATFVATYELASYAQKNGVKNVVGFNIGGTTEIAGLKITLVQAFHTASCGAPTGFIIKGKDKTIYHAGDTGIFSDMRLIGELYRPGIALLPIGGYYTMGPHEAAVAASLVKSEIVIPMHYMTFPILTQTADEFVRNVEEKAVGTKVVVLRPGEAYED